MTRDGGELRAAAFSFANLNLQLLFSFEFIFVPMMHAREEHLLRWCLCAGDPFVEMLMAAPRARALVCRDADENDSNSDSESDRDDAQSTIAAEHSAALVHGALWTACDVPFEFLVNDECTGSNVRVVDGDNAGPHTIDVSPEIVVGTVPREWVARRSEGRAIPTDGIRRHLLIARSHPTRAGDPGRRIKPDSDKRILPPRQRDRPHP